MNTIFETSFEYKLIYIFTIADNAHKGLLKIGDTSIHSDKSPDNLPPNCSELNQAARNRIKAYTNTAGITVNLLHTELAIRTIKDSDGNLNLKVFRDHDIHRVLINSRIEKKKFENSGGKEWFVVDLQTAFKAIEAVKIGRKNISHTDLEGYHIPIVFRPEQEDAINKTLKQFKHGNTMLWNAKMRFGKTLCALEVVRQSGFNKTIIITHRPVVDDSWYEDFKKLFHGNHEYDYGSKSNGITVKSLVKEGKKFVYFASMQDLRGSATVGGKFDKNNLIFNTNWDFVVVDEAHEGTTTSLGEDVIQSVVKEGKESQTKFLALSGTPFNILKNYDNNVYTWDYVMEQKHKKEWDLKNFGDSNPYDELPELRIFTYDLGKIISDKQYVELDDKAFNFKEFFRVWTGDIKVDHIQMPGDVQVGDFFHYKDVRSFIDLITKDSKDNNYPYSKKEYRDLFKHSLWMVPGVKEAKALSKMMKSHPVFGSGMFNIVNVAGDGDEEEKSDEALKKVRDAIKAAGEGFTITLSCGRLTTGVTVPEWTAVFMLSGSFSTSASNYLQTIFRVQSPCNNNGKIKKYCYVFDFAPDRTLKMIAESAALSTKAGKASENDKRIMGEFLNYCPVIAVDGTEMKSYDPNKLLQQLKRAYAERAVFNGFDDYNLYSDELLKLQDIDIINFNKLKGIIGASKAAPKSTEIDINHQGFTDEEYEEITHIEKKPKKFRTPEEEERLRLLREQQNERRNAISILRGISIRMPLMIYGADVDINEDITLENLVDIIDDSSWLEFMPNGVSKELFKEFIKYYDAEIFIAAGRRIRNIVYSADELSPTERIKKITDLFACFKNPDKETVLTPWRVVNMHMSDCLGGYDFYDDEHKLLLEIPRYVYKGKVTSETLANPDGQILEINSKTGLYPLYAAYSIFRSKCAVYDEKDLNFDLLEQLWGETVQENVFVICKTPMAKQITRRTLVGYKEIHVNAHYFEDLINMLKNKPKQFKERVLKSSYWKKEGFVTMKFDAIIGNPPYQSETGSTSRQATPIYNYFIDQAKKLSPNYMSMIMPSRWFAGGMGLDQFRIDMMNDKRICKITDYVNAKDCFPQISISGGVCYFLFDGNSKEDCEFTNIFNGKKSVMTRPLNEFNVLVRFNEAVAILRKVASYNEIRMSEIVSSISPFGLSTSFRGEKSKSDTNNIKLYSSAGISYISLDKVVKGKEQLSSYKVMVSQTSAEHAGEPSKDGSYRVLTSAMVVMNPNEVCTHSYLTVGNYDNANTSKNLLLYLKTKFVRFLILQAMSSIHITKSTFAFVPQQDFSKSYTDEELYIKYSLNNEEIAFIESTIKPMD